MLGAIIARRLRAIRPKPHTTWHLDEMFVSIIGNCLVQSRRNKAAALRLIRELIRKYRMVPATFVTGRLFHTEAFETWRAAVVVAALNRVHLQSVRHELNNARSNCPLGSRHQKGCASRRSNSSRPYSK